MWGRPQRLSTPSNGPQNRKVNSAACAVPFLPHCAANNSGKIFRAHGPSACAREQTLPGRERRVVGLTWKTGKQAEVNSYIFSEMIGVVSGMKKPGYLHRVGFCLRVLLGS